LEGLRFHDLRGLNASLLARSGVDPKTAANRLGHSDIRLTLDVYGCWTTPTGRRPRSSTAGSSPRRAWV
jgi:integrase